MSKCYYLHQTVIAEPTLQSMLDTLSERKELDVTFTYEQGEDGSDFDIVILSLFHSLYCTFTGSNDINDILHVLGPTCYEFHRLGRGLNLEESVMKEILYEARSSPPYDSLARVLEKWLTWNYPHERFGNPSLSLLIKAVDLYDHRLAIKVFKTFTDAAGEPRFAH